MITIGGTNTSEGFIPYLRANGIDMPVRLAIPSKAPITLLKMLQPPLRNHAGELQYVLPGGATFQP